MFQANDRAKTMFLSGLAAAWAFTCPCLAAAPPSPIGKELHNTALSVVRAAMREGKVFEKVHAAEILIWTGHPEGVKDFYLQEERTASNEISYRIGIWRVLYRCNADNPAKQQEYLRKIVGVFSDPTVKDQTTAGETLGKLKYTGADCSELVAKLAQHDTGELRVWARWMLANSGKPKDEAYLAELLRSNNPPDRENTVYALRHFKTLRPETVKLLAETLPVDLAAGVEPYYLLGTQYTHVPADERAPVAKKLFKYTATGNTDQRYQACMALANWPTEDMIPEVVKLLDNKPWDERVGGAYVLLRMGQARDAADPNH